MLIAISVITVAAIAYVFFIKRRMPAFFTGGLMLVFSGACGNLIDRIIYGAVLDFIDIRVWPVFNIADSSITIGVCLILWQVLKDRKVRIKD